MLTTGQTAPLFSLPTDTGAFNLADHHGKNVIVFFFPRADTSGCTKEAIAFSALKEEFEAANSLVIGISKDTPEKQAKFRAKHGLTCLLGADFNSDVCEQFGVWVEKSMYGRTYMHFLYQINFLQLMTCSRKFPFHTYYSQLQKLQAISKEKRYYKIHKLDLGLLRHHQNKLYKHYWSHYIYVKKQDLYL